MGKLLAIMIVSITIRTKHKNENKTKHNNNKKKYNIKIITKLMITVMIITRNLQVKDRFYIYKLVLGNSTSIKNSSNVFFFSKGYPQSSS